MPKIARPEYYERINAYGANGSGKSVFMRELLALFPRWVVIDSKGDFEPKGKYTIIRKPNDVRWKIAKRILYRPLPDYNQGGWLDEICRRLYIRAQKEGKKKPFIIYVDETLFMSKVGKTKWLSALAVTTRSLGVGLWTSSQRPKWIPVEIRSEAWRQYIFYLQHEEDKKEIVKETGGRISLQDLNEQDGDYSFWEIRRIKGGKTTVTHYPPIKIT